MDTKLQHYITIENVYVDGCMVELATCFLSGDWGAKATVYTQFENLAKFAAQLDAFSAARCPEVLFSAGREDSPSGFLNMRFHSLHYSGRCACQLKLATEAATDCRPEEISKMSIELAIDISTLGAFIADLRRMYVRGSKAIIKLF